MGIAKYVYLNQVVRYIGGIEERSNISSHSSITKAKKAFDKELKEVSDTVDYELKDEHIDNKFLSRPGTNVYARVETIKLILNTNKQSIVEAVDLAKAG